MLLTYLRERLRPLLYPVERWYSPGVKMAAVTPYILEAIDKAMRHSSARFKKRVPRLILTTVARSGLALSSTASQSQASCHSMKPRLRIVNCLGQAEASVRTHDLPTRIVEHDVAYDHFQFIRLFKKRLTLTSQFVSNFERLVQTFRSRTRLSFSSISPHRPLPNRRPPVSAIADFRLRFRKLRRATLGFASRRKQWFLTWRPFRRFDVTLMLSRFP
jgi:hypothetical protein